MEERKRQCNYCPQNPGSKPAHGEYGQMVENIGRVDPNAVLPNTCAQKDNCPQQEGKGGQKPAE